MARAEAELTEAKQLFDALDYEHAVPAFDRAIATLEPLAAQQVTSRPALATAYELPRPRALRPRAIATAPSADFQVAARRSTPRSRSRRRSRRASWRCSTR